MIICPNCQHANHEGVLICSKCHTPLDEAIRRQSQTLHFEGQGSGQNEPRFGTARFQPHTQLLLRHHSSIHIIQVDVYQFREVILGRTDPDTGQAPDVDLEVFDAVQWGVSRRHARLDVQDNSLRITDLESANSTYLNGLRLMPNQPRILRNGDEITLGRLKLQVTFIDSMGLE